VGREATAPSTTTALRPTLWPALWPGFRAGGSTLRAPCQAGERGLTPILTCA